MKCPYCGAEAKGRYCEYCDSEMPAIAWQIPVQSTADSDNIINTENTEPVEKSIKKEEAPAAEKKYYAGDNAIDIIIDFLMDADVDAQKFWLGQELKNRSNVRGASKVHDRIYKTLGIMRDEKVYIIHDDTLMKTGKNGFAITENGFYCTPLWEKTSFVSWDELWEAKTVKKSESGNQVVNVDKIPVAYFTGSNTEYEKLELLVQSLYAMGS